MSRKQYKNLKERLRKITLLRKKGSTLKEIGDAFGISQERVRQLITQKKYKKCFSHHIKFLILCPYCEIKNSYLKILSRIIKNSRSLLYEAKRLSELDRKKVSIIQKAIFIKTVKNSLHYSFNKIARLLKKHHSSIINLYNTSYEI